MDHFLYRFSSLNFSEKCTIELRSFNFSSSFICAVVEMPLEGLSFVKMLATFGIIYATDPLLQNVSKIVCLR